MRQSRPQKCLINLDLPETEQELPPNLAEVNPGTETLVPNLAQVKPGTKTRDIAAAAVGMKREIYRQAKTVVKSGDQEVIQAMDTGEKSINAAYNSIKKTPKPMTFNVTLHKNLKDDAEMLLSKVGPEYCTELAVALLKAAGHNVELG